LHNVAFRDMVNLVEAFGFVRDRISESHQVFVHPGIREIISLQDVNGQAKPYQIRQFLRLVERYNLALAQGRGEGGVIRERLPH